MDSGIYKICSLSTNRFYIGQSRFISRRWKQHLQKLGTQKHSNKFLQNVFNKYGAEDLIFAVLEHCSIEELDLIEQKYLDTFCKDILCMNISPAANNPVASLPRTAEWCHKIAESSKGKIMSEDAKAKIRAARAKQIFPVGCFAKRDEARRGKERDPEIGKKISASLTGHKLSQEHVQSLILSHPGKSILAIDASGNQRVFISKREAAEYFNCTKGAISAAIRTGNYTLRKSAKLYNWKFQYKDNQ